MGRPAGELASFEYGHSHEGADELKSAHLLSDFYPEGSWSTGQTAEIARQDDGATSEIIVGPGWTSGETSHNATAVHDLIVGLMCFDQVLVPLDCIARVFDMVGEDRFRALVFDGVLQFVHWEGFDLVICASNRPGFGTLGTGKKGGGGESPGEMIRRQMRPAPGRELIGAELISRLEERAISINLSGTRDFANVCSGLFSSPATRRTLGMSDGTPVGHIPRWLAHPALRLVQIARIGATCQRLAFGSMKLMTGAAKLAEVAFSAVASGVLASEAANYTLTGQFSMIQQSAFLAEPRLWDSVLRFRGTNSGVAFRSEIFKRLLRNDAAEIVPALDSSLKQLLPTHILEASRKEMSALLVSTSGRAVVPAVWNDALLLQEGPEAWRRASKQRLLDFMAAHQINDYHDCPCGSHERLKFCCLAELA
jgi:hypothetical protein